MTARNLFTRAHLAFALTLLLTARGSSLTAQSRLNRDTPRPNKMYVVVVGMAQHRMGLIVDELLGQQDIVIKSLGKSLEGISGIAGATELGNQQTVLVLDMAALVEETLTQGVEAA